LVDTPVPTIAKACAKAATNIKVKAVATSISIKVNARVGLTNRRVGNLK
jgi:hypothetical protein